MTAEPTTDAYAVVAGAAGGIGRVIARRLAQQGPVALLDIDGHALDGVVEVLIADDIPDTHVLAIPADLADAAAVRTAMARLQPAGIRSVAVSLGTTTGGSLADLSDDDWDSTLDSCLRSVMNVLRAAVSGMPDGGPICVLGSVHSHQPVPGFPAYAAAKAAVVSLARQVALEYGPHGIRVNVVTPGWTSTPHTRGRLAPEDERRLVDATPLRDLVEPDDIAAAVEFLLSPLARRITGAELVVDAGASLVPGVSLLRDAHRVTLGLPPL